MLPKGFRLRGRVAIQRVRRHGKQWRHPLAILLVGRQVEGVNRAAAGIPDTGPQATRFAFAASRYVGDAVARNRAKRLMREAVRAYLPRVIPGSDCLLIARQGSPNATYAEMVQAIGTLLSRAQLLGAPVPEGRKNGSAQDG